METRIKFKWPVSPVGYQIINHIDGKDYLMEIDQLQVKEYNCLLPLEKEKLFWEFTQVYEPSDVIDFANNYGFLGESTTVLEAVDEQHVIGETLEFWLQQASEMRDAYNLWRAIVEDDVDVMLANNEVRRLDMQRDEYECDWQIDQPLLDPILFLLKHGTLPPQNIMRITLRDETDCARHILMRIANKHLSGKVSMQLIYDTDEQQETWGMAWTPVPDSLLSAMWMKFAEMVSKSYAHRTCPTCGAPFSIDRPLKRKTRKYCDSSCRFQAYIARKQAPELKNQGLSVEQIAERLKVTPIYIAELLDKAEV